MTETYPKENETSSKGSTTQFDSKPHQYVAKISKETNKSISKSDVDNVKIYASPGKESVKIPYNIGEAKERETRKRIKNLLMK